MKNFCILRVVLVVGALMVTLALASDTFEKWKEANGRNYKSSQHADKAKSAYDKADAAIKENNADPNKTFTMGHNNHSDLTEEQKKGRMGSNGTKVKAALKTVDKIPTNQKVKGDSVGKQTPRPLPANISFVKMMSPVKDQGKCGADYLMAITGVYEFWTLYNKTQYPVKVLSEQSLIDCDSKNRGCDGGDPCQALLFVAKNGISDGSTYKFIGKNGTCMRSKYPAKTFFKRPCGQENNGDEKLMQRVLAGHGPLIVYLNLAGTGFEQYKSGIFQSTKCSKKLDKADFAMVVVGYGTQIDKTSKVATDFWILRNSMGTKWGENGHMRILRGKNMCGVANVFLTVC